MISVDNVYKSVDKARNAQIIILLYYMGRKKSVDSFVD